MAEMATGLMCLHDVATKLWDKELLQKKSDLNRLLATSEKVRNFMPRQW